MGVAERLGNGLEWAATVDDIEVTMWLAKWRADDEDAEEAKKQARLAAQFDAMRNKHGHPG